MTSLVEVRQLWFRYGGRGSGGGNDRDWALRDVSLSFDRGSTVGLVGETGSGKSTLIRVLCGLVHGESGSVRFAGQEVSDWLGRTRRDFRRQNQMVFQSPASSLDPRMRMRTSLAEPVKAIERRSPSPQELVRSLAEVGLGPEVLTRYPHQLSGGQLQRIAIARALSVRPAALYADEPTSALDVSVQAQVLNLLMRLRARHGLTLVMVSHDLTVVSRLCEHLVVMKDGEIAESGPTATILRRPTAPYTAKLIEAAQAVSLAKA